VIIVDLVKYSAPGLPSLLRLSELETKTETLKNLYKVDKYTSFAEEYMEIQECSYFMQVNSRKMGVEPRQPSLMLYCGHCESLA